MRKTYYDLCKNFLKVFVPVSIVVLFLMLYPKFRYIPNGLVWTITVSISSSLLALGTFLIIMKLKRNMLKEKEFANVRNYYMGLITFTIAGLVVFALPFTTFKVPSDSFQYLFDTSQEFCDYNTENCCSEDNCMIGLKTVSKNVKFFYPNNYETLQQNKLMRTVVGNGSSILFMVADFSTAGYNEFQDYVEVEYNKFSSTGSQIGVLGSDLSNGEYFGINGYKIELTVNSDFMEAFADLTFPEGENFKMLHYYFPLGETYFVAIQIGGFEDNFEVLMEELEPYLKKMEIE